MPSIYLIPFILGGWTAIQMITFPESNLRFESSWYDFKGLFNYKDPRQLVSSTSLLQLRNNIGFKQLRFYCHKKKVGTVFHIMTNVNPMGEAVVKFFTEEDLISTRPKTCGSYIVLPDDNSTLSKDCSILGWNKTHADSRWAGFNNVYENRIMRPILRRWHSHRFISAPTKRDCDDFQSLEASLSSGDTWAIFVR